MLITPEKFEKVAHDLRSDTAFDFETNGLDPRTGSKAFIMGWANEDGMSSVLLDNYRVRSNLSVFFGHTNLRYAAHNAKFELGFLRHQFGVDVAGTIWDTECFARVTKNNEFSYSLQNCALRMGMTKHEPMLAWLKKRKNKNMYHLAPTELIVPYVEQDANLSHILMNNQLQTFKEWDTSPVPIKRVVALETATTKALFEMEDKGLRVDVDYCKEALKYEQQRALEYEDLYKDLTGESLVDSYKSLQRVFDRHHIKYGSTEKGNPSFTVDALEVSKDHTIVQCLLGYRGANKRASTYWENFITFQSKGVMHPNIRQTGADTFRMSVTRPACQTWPDDVSADHLYPIRKAFIAPEGMQLLSIDYAAMELRIMADESEEMAMIKAIQEGTDFHQEVADMAGVSRNLAKSGRFAKLYGAGVPRIAVTLGVPMELAVKINNAIDEQTPRIKQYSNYLIHYAKTAPYGYNWMGRRYVFNRGFEYLYPNYRIQGGCSEILRIAICNITKLLKGKKSAVILPIHDELVFNWHPEDDHLLPEVKRLMIAAHRNKKHLALDVAIYKGDNLHEMTEIKV